jgi:DNA transposition AAA+ family ATPase
MTVCSGSKLLAKFLHDNGITKAAAKRAIGISDPTLADYLSGARRPSEPRRVRIEKWTAGVVPARSWETKEEREVARNVVPFKRAAGAE